MKRFIVTSLLVSLLNGFSSVQAGLNASAEYILSPNGLQDIAENLLRAKTRSDELISFPIGHVVMDNDVKTRIILSCPAKLPDAKGEGCKLTFNSNNTGELGQIHFSIDKPVSTQLLTAKISEINTKLKSLNPNQVADYDHQHFGNPFYEITDTSLDGTHYFCQSVGASGSKAWECHLWVVEKLQQ